MTPLGTNPLRNISWCCKALLPSYVLWVGGLYFTVCHLYLTQQPIRHTLQNFECCLCYVILKNAIYKEQDYVESIVATPAWLYIIHTECSIIIMLPNFYRMLIIVCWSTF